MRKATQLLRGQDKMSPLQSALNPLCPFAAHTCSRLLTAGSCLIRVLRLIHACFSGTWAHTRNLIYVCVEQQMSPMLFTLFI